ncbi:sugar ABC transporter permease [uncultured Jatrophihabitans sp.]|uniref:sugar ABC transporter permease n=1 Tax=uncultured Jatrophihabitans sp. TaxID=1610747 RepID=UPI0035CA24B1
MTPPNLGKPTSTVKSDEDLAKTGSTPERASSFSLDVERRSIRDALQGYVDKLRTGEPGALPSVLGLIVLGIIFSQVSGRFLTDYNIGNLPGQGAYIALIAMGLVFVLLLGEIDLSGGTTGGMCAGFAAQAIFQSGLHGGGVPTGLYWSILGGMALMAALGFYLKSISGPIVVILGILVVVFQLDKHELFAMFFAVALGCAVGILIGWLVASVGIPSFIVTLALFLAFQGVLLFALNSQSKKINDYKAWNGLANNNLTPAWSWVFTIVVIGGYLAFTVLKSVTAQRKGLAADEISLVLVRAGLIAVAAVVLTILANRNRNVLPYGKLEGIPYAAAIPIALMIVSTLALYHTSWGRHLFATGGNAEAARRAGIDVTHIRVTAFTVSGGFAALGGLFLASSAGAVVLNLGGGNILLFSVAAAVIGGTSLFGGRGKPQNAVIGALVITIIPNGIGLKPNLGPQYQQVITGVVLLVAATVDALSRRRAVKR